MEEYSYPKIYLYRHLVKAKLFMDQQFHEKIDLNSIAGEAYFSKFHFVRLFQKIYNKTPHQYLIGVRIENAKKLLQDGMPVAEVCMAVGFESISSFTGLFKRIEKLTPSAYRSQELAKLAEIIKTPLKFVPHCFAESKGWIKKSNFQEA